LTPRRPERPSSDRQIFTTQSVNKFASFSCHPFDIAFAGAGRKRARHLSSAAAERRAEAQVTADLLLAGGLPESAVYAATDGDTMLDLATCGLLHTYLGRSRRGWHGFADEAHRVKTRWGRDYAAFCDEHGYPKVVQVVVRAPVSVIPLVDLRRTHAEDSERLNEKLRYGRKRISSGYYLSRGRVGR